MDSTVSAREDSGDADDEESEVLCEIAAELSDYIASPLGQEGTEYVFSAPVEVKVTVLKPSPYVGETQDPNEGLQGTEDDHELLTRWKEYDAKETVGEGSQEAVREERVVEPSLSEEHVRQESVVAQQQKEKHALDLIHAASSDPDRSYVEEILNAAQADLLSNSDTLSVKSATSDDDDSHDFTIQVGKSWAVCDTERSNKEIANFFSLVDRELHNTVEGSKDDVFEAFLAQCKIETKKIFDVPQLKFKMIDYAIHKRSTIETLVRRNLLEREVTFNDLLDGLRDKRTNGLEISLLILGDMFDINISVVTPDCIWQNRFFDWDKAEMYFCVNNEGHVRGSVRNSGDKVTLQLPKLPKIIKPPIQVPDTPIVDTTVPNEESDLCKTPTQDTQGIVHCRTSLDPTMEDFKPGQIESYLTLLCRDIVKVPVSKNNIFDAVRLQIIAKKKGCRYPAPHMRYHLLHELVAEQQHMEKCLAENLQLRNMSFETYFSKMKNGTTCGFDLTLIGLANLYATPICCFTTRGIWVSHDIEPARCKIFLIMYGNGHFDAVASKFTFVNVYDIPKYHPDNMESLNLHKPIQASSPNMEAAEALLQLSQSLSPIVAPASKADTIKSPDVVITAQMKAHKPQGHDSDLDIQITHYEPGDGTFQRQKKPRRRVFLNIQDKENRPVKPRIPVETIVKVEPPDSFESTADSTTSTLPDIKPPVIKKVEIRKVITSSEAASVPFKSSDDCNKSSDHSIRRQVAKKSTGKGHKGHQYHSILQEAKSSEAPDVPQFVCKFCPFRFYTERGLDTHLEGQHPEKLKSRQFKCDLCKKSFNEFHKFQSHVDLMHPDRWAKQISSKEEEFIDATQSPKSNGFPSTVSGIDESSQDVDELKVVDSTKKRRRLSRKKIPKKVEVALESMERVQQERLGSLSPEAKQHEAKAEKNDIPKVKEKKVGDKEKEISDKEKKVREKEKKVREKEKKVGESEEISATKKSESIKEFEEKRSERLRRKAERMKVESAMDSTGKSEGEHEQELKAEKKSRRNKQVKEESIRDDSDEWKPEGESKEVSDEEYQSDGQKTKKARRKAKPKSQGKAESDYTEPKKGRSKAKRKGKSEDNDDEDTDVGPKKKQPKLRKSLRISSRVKEETPDAEESKDQSEDVQSPTKKETSDEALMTCVKCDEEFKTFNDLTLHRLKCFKNKRRYRCTGKGCTKSYQDKNMLLQHYNYKHTKKPKPFTCEEHQLSYQFEKSYKEHLRRKHSKDFKYMCEHCGQGYGHKGEYTAHVNRVHLNYRPYGCTVCNKATFATVSELSYHVKRCGKELDFPCKQCSNIYHSEKSLKQHIKDSHSDVEYNCPACDRKYKSQGGMYRHMRDEHNIRKRRGTDIDVSEVVDDGAKKKKAKKSGK